MAPVILFVTTVVFGVGLISAVVVAIQLRIKLAKYDGIANTDEYLSQCRNQTNELKLTAESYAKEIAKQKQVYAKYNEAIGICKTAAEAKAKADQFEVEAERLRALIGEARTAADIQTKVSALKEELMNYSAAIGHAKTAAEYQSRAGSLKEEIRTLEAQISFLNEAAEMQEYGVQQRRYSYDHPEEFKTAIDRVVDSQKQMIRGDAACTCQIEWVVEGSKQKGKQMVKEQIKLMLRAFNGECDAAISKVKHNNLAAIESRICKCFTQLNKLGAAKQISLSDQYLRLRLKELELTHHYELAKQVARDKQRELKESMQEEAKAEREIEEARRKAEKDESEKAKALEVARKQLAEEHGKHNEKLAELVAKLETELKDALDRKAKAIARAQLTRSGFVYVLSNVGTLGEGRYKIGMTRRLVPDERVSELGDASVPFPFDIHAMIYSEDAPALESKLHKEFDARRVNMVNTRKEYFDVPLDEIMEAVSRLHGTVTYVTEPPAEQYRESIKLRIESDDSSSPVVEAAIAS